MTKENGAVLMKLRNFDLDLLRTFCKVVDTGGFTSASDHLHVTQSTVSVHMARLEEFVGYRLLDRQRGGVLLTEHGEVLLNCARQILNLNDQTMMRMADFELRGSLRLGVVEYLAPHRLPGIIARLRSTFPGLDLRLKIDLSGSLHRDLDDGKLDIVIAARMDGVAGGLDFIEEQLCWAINSELPVDREGPVPLAMLPPPCFYREAAIRALDLAGRAWVPAVTTMNVGGVQAAVNAGLAVGVLSQSSLLSSMKVLGAEDDFPPLPSFRLAVFTGRGEPYPGVKPVVAFIMGEVAGSSHCNLAA